MKSSLEVISEPRKELVGEEDWADDDEKNSEGENREEIDQNKKPDTESKEESQALGENPIQSNL